VPTPTPLSQSDYEGLAAFRHALRRFVAQSEQRARAVGLTPQQHQALLSIKGGFPGREEVTIGDLAEHLQLRNHSAVGLVARLVGAGLVEREPSPADRRRIRLRLTPQGEALLARVSGANLLELKSSARLMAAFLASLAEADEA
jgi:DNA-binding MarR family transcriptional regulator